MKFINLHGHAYVAGALRSPEEGVLEVEDAEAERLIDGGLAADVSDDFVADTAVPDTKPAGRKAAGSKE